MAKKKSNFEESLKRLNEIVNHLEGGDRSLDESLALFEEGAGLVKMCNELLDDAEQKISILKNNYEEEPNEVKYVTDF